MGDVGLRVDNYHYYKKTSPFLYMMVVSFLFLSQSSYLSQLIQVLHAGNNHHLHLVVVTTGITTVALTEANTKEGIVVLLVQRVLEGFSVFDPTLSPHSV